MIKQHIAVDENNLEWRESRFVKNWKYAYLYTEDMDHNHLFIGPYALLCRSEGDVEYGPNISNDSIEYYLVEGALTLILNQETTARLNKGSYLRVPRNTEIKLTASSGMTLFISAHGQVIWFEHVLKRIKENNLSSLDAETLCQEPWLPYLRNVIYCDNKEPDEGIRQALRDYLNIQAVDGAKFSPWKLQFAINLCRNLRDDSVTRKITEIIDSDYCNLNIRIVSLLHLMNVDEDLFRNGLWKKQKEILEKSALEVLQSNCIYYGATDVEGLRKALEKRLLSQADSHKKQKEYYKFLLHLIENSANSVKEISRED